MSYLYLSISSTNITVFINISISNLSHVYLYIFDDEQFSFPRATRSDKAKLVELQSRSFAEPFDRFSIFRVMHARRQTRLGIKVKVRARFNLDLGGGRRAIRAECTAHCCAEHCRCAGAKPSTCYRDTDTLSPRINLRFSKFRRNFLLLISARIFRMREYFWYEEEEVKEREESLWREGRINTRADDRSSKGGIPPVCKGCSGHVNLSWFEWRVSTVARPGQLLLTWLAIGPARRLPCYGREEKTVPVIDNNLSPSRLLPKFLKLCRILLNRARNERVKEGGVQKGEKRRIVENKVRACSPFFSFTTFVSRCDVALPLLLPHPFFSSPFFVGDRPCCCTRAPPNRITARGKRNFQKE